MGRFSRCRAGIPWRQGLASWRRLLASVTLLALALGASGLLITALMATGASAYARGAQVAVIPSHPPQPTRTPPRPTPPGKDTPSPTPPTTVVPSPTPPATGAPGSTPPATSVADPTATPNAATATMAPTVVTTGTANSGGGRDDSAGSGHDRTPGADGPSDVLVLGPVALLLLAFSVFMALEARRDARKGHQRVPVSAAQNPAHAQVNQSHQELPLQKAVSPTWAEDAGGRTRKQRHTPKPLLPPQETLPTPTPRLPPRWLIDAGLLPQDLVELPPEDVQEQ